jgi:asparagine synthase (glutamine-hydrolysing)
MCGVAGVLDWRGKDHVSWRTPAGTLAAMARALRHRGPDGDGFLSRPALGMAHTRLAIVDLEGGDQPVFNEDGSVAVVFNGEIFNHIELRASLQARGHTFATRSDTEVIVHLYEEHGDAFVHHLNGQFAIALWDERQQRLLLVRDRVGIAPLFYRLAQRDDEPQLMFGSEVKAILAGMSPQLRARVQMDREALAQVFTCWAPVGNRSMFEGIRSLEPGTMLVAEQGPDQGLSHRVSRYWDWSFPPLADARAPVDEEEVLAEVRSLLIDATRLRLRADVPVGAYLSGGLDSSIITSLIHHESDAPLRTFSLGFEDRSLDESAHQQEMVRHLGARHSRIDCSAAQVGQSLIDTVWHTEAPVMRTAPAPMRMLSGLVRQQAHKVVLTGEGADEVFGGYDLFKEAQVRQFWARQPASTWRPSLLGRLYPYQDRGSARAGRFVQGFYGVGLDQPDDPLFGHLPRLETTGASRMFLRDPGEPEATHHALRQLMPDAAAGWHPLARSQYLEAKVLMGNYLLSAQGDRMLMANGVEGRFPFLDHRLIELANRMPPRLKVRALREKIALKKAFATYLPQQTTARHKQPYRAPDAAALFDPATGQLWPQLEAIMTPEALRRADCFEADKVAMLVRKAGRVIQAAAAGGGPGASLGIRDNQALVGIVTTQAWHHHFMASPVSRDAGMAEAPH